MMMDCTMFYVPGAGEARAPAAALAFTSPIVVGQIGISGQPSTYQARSRRPRRENTWLQDCPRG